MTGLEIKPGKFVLQSYENVLFKNHRRACFLQSNHFFLTNAINISDIKIKIVSFVCTDV